MTENRSCNLNTTLLVKENTRYLKYIETLNKNKGPVREDVGVKTQPICDISAFTNHSHKETAAF